MSLWCSMYNSTFVLLLSFPFSSPLPSLFSCLNFFIHQYVVDFFLSSSWPCFIHFYFISHARILSDSQSHQWYHIIIRHIVSFQLFQNICHSLLFKFLNYTVFLFIIDHIYFFALSFEFFLAGFQFI